MTPERLLAERAARRRLLNAYLRESGRSMTSTGDGLVRIALADGERALVVELTHRSAFGHHEYGDEVWLETTGVPRTALAHTEVVGAILDEVESLAAQAFPGGGSGNKAVLAEQIESSVAATARYLGHRRPQPPKPPKQSTPHELTRHAEQSLVYGHPFHPTPKSTQGFGDELPRFAPELGATFRLHWFAVASDALLERRVAPGSWVPPEVAEHAPDGYAPLPVHPWQAGYLRRLPRVGDLLRDGAIVDLGELGDPVYPTSSVRTVCDPAFATSWKLPLHVRITNFVRNNPVEHVQRATDAGALIARLAPQWPHPGFGVLNETGFRTVDPALAGDELAADFAVLFRENPFTDGRYAPRVLAGLLDESTGEVPELVREVRRSGGSPAEWLHRYLGIWLLPLLDIFGRDGVSFEAHVQNSLLHTENGWPSRVWVRDLEGTSVSAKRLRGQPLDEHSPLRYDDEEAWLRLQYHAVSNHLGHLVHVLGRYGGVAESRLWAAAREALAAAPGEPARTLLETPVLPAKANLVSRFAGRGERPLYVDVPNPLHEVSR